MCFDDSGVMGWVSGQWQETNEETLLKSCDTKFIFSLFPDIHNRWGDVSSIFSFSFFLFLICNYLSTPGLSWWHVGSFLVAHELSSCGTRPLECKGSIVFVCGLSCPLACGILVSQPGIKPASPALQDRFLTTGPGKSHLFLFYAGPMEDINFIIS